MRELKKLFIYVLLIIGTVVMIAPFAWMLVTSFKLPSEVNSWPPRWTTKSFLSSRIVKVVPSTGTVSTAKGLSLREALTFVSKKSTGLNLVVNDDPFYRGTLRIPLKNAKYSYGIDKQKLDEFIQKLELPQEFSNEYGTPEEFFESVFLYYKSGANPYFKRSEFTNNLLMTLDSLFDTIDTIMTFGIDRIVDDEERGNFENFLRAKQKDIEELKTKLEKFKAGTELVLSDKEIHEILSIINNYNFVYDGFNEISDNYNNVFRGGLGTYLQNIKFYTEVATYFGQIQSLVVDSDIIAVPMTKKERIELLIKRSEDLKDNKLLQEIVRNVPLNSVVEEFAKRLDDRILKEYELSSSELTSIKTLIGNLINIALENGIDVEKEASVSFENLTKRIEEVVGFNLSYMSTKSKLDAFAEEIDNSENLFKDITLNIQEMQNLRNIYESTIYAWKIKTAPAFVKDILVKEGKNVEIVMEGVHPVYFVDDNIQTVSLTFMFSEVVKNIFQNYVDAWNAAPFGRYYANTIFVAVVTTILEVIISAMAAYAFSWMNFPGKKILFSIFLATMMVPGEVLLVPNFITVTKLGWIDTYYALIVPWVVSVFSIFLMRQHFMSIPTELFDAAKIDGSSHWRFLWQIVVPLSKPVVITSALLKFVGSWNAFLWVLIVTNSPKYRTLTVGLQAFSSEVGTLYNMLMAAATFSILPVVVIFLFTQKYFVRGIARTGLK